VKSDTTAPADPKIGAVVPVELMLNDRSDPSSATKGRWAGGDQNAIYRGTADLADGQIVIVQMTNLGLAVVSPDGGGCTCVCVEPNMLHPDGFETTTDWDVVIPKDVPWQPTSDASGDVMVPAGTYRVVWATGTNPVTGSSWNNGGGWKLDITDDLVFRDSNDDVVAPTSSEGWIVVEYTTANILKVVVDFDGVVPAPA
jgi:hypothetical protein